MYCRPRSARICLKLLHPHDSSYRSQHDTFGFGRFRVSAVINHNQRIKQMISGQASYVY